MRTANPVLSERLFERYLQESGGVARMTVGGTVVKSITLLGILLVPAVWLWTKFLTGGATLGLVGPQVIPYMLGGAIGGLVLALVTCFKPQWAFGTAPLYAACEGLFVGGASILAQIRWPGIVLPAVTITFGIFLAMLLLYTSRTIRATPALTKGIMIATLGVALTYLLSWILGMFGTTIPFIHQGGALGIGFSLVVIGIAAFNFILDFDLIEQGAASGAPKYMEWYGGFALLVTLVWLYLEVLRLLSKLRER
jgi:uncharacterized YccA/Bax inhibitor family protein